MKNTLRNKRNGTIIRFNLDSKGSCSEEGIFTVYKYDFYLFASLNNVN